MKSRTTALCAAALLSGLGCSKQKPGPDASDDAVSWIVDNLNSVNGRVPTVLGSPTVKPLEPGASLCFDGVDDGLIFDKNPLESRAAFTVEVLFRPDAAGPSEQRFVHIQESGSQDRAMIETRVTGDTFYLDTFLGSRGAKVTLAEPTLSHPASTFHWAALSYATATCVNSWTARKSSKARSLLRRWAQDRCPSAFA